MEVIHKNDPKKRINGIEYFSWMKDKMPDTVKDFVILADLRDPLDVGKYDLVNCTEVGEHIDPGYCSVFLDNIKKMTKRYVIMTWAKSGGIKDIAHDPHCQHLNPLPFDEFISLMEKNEFVLNKKLTARLKKKYSSKKHFYPWWKKSITVWEIKK